MLHLHGPCPLFGLSSFPHNFGDTKGHKTRKRSKGGWWKVEITSPLRLPALISLRNQAFMASFTHSFTHVMSTDTEPCCVLGAGRPGCRPLLTEPSVRNMGESPGNTPVAESCHDPHGNTETQNPGGSGSLPGGSDI